VSSHQSLNQESSTRKESSTWCATVPGPLLLFFDYLVREVFGPRRGKVIHLPSRRAINRVFDPTCGLRPLLLMRSSVGKSVYRAPEVWDFASTSWGTLQRSNQTWPTCRVSDCTSLREDLARLRRFNSAKLGTLSKKAETLWQQAAKPQPLSLLAFIVSLPLALRKDAGDHVQW